MKLGEVTLLAVVQGLSEFLPISSSGHLVVFQKLLPGFYQPGILFDVFLHLGTLFSVLIYFRKRILKMFIDDFWYILVASVPSGLVGILLSDFFEGLFSRTFFVGFEFLINAAISFGIAKMHDKEGLVNFRSSLAVGIAQAISISPGISRSGATVFAGIATGVRKSRAVEFSFIISIPAILGANIVQLLKYGSNGYINYPYYIFGLFVSFIVGLVAIKIVFEFIKGARFIYFAWYSLLAGVLVILLSL